jgi:hypothetical protein
VQFFLIYKKRNIPNLVISFTALISPMPSTPANDSTTMSGISKSPKINIGRHCSKECCTLLVTIVNKGIFQAQKDYYRFTKKLK